MKNILILFPILFSTISPSENLTINSVSKNRQEISQVFKKELSIFNVKKHIEDISIQHGNIVFKQVLLETDWLNSKLCKVHNNLFGMNYPVKRPTTAIGYVYGDPHPTTGKLRRKAVFNNWQDSIEDYLLYQKYWKSKGKDLSNYWHFLTQLGYSETSGYINVLKTIKI